MNWSEYREDHKGSKRYHSGTKQSVKMLLERTDVLHILTGIPNIQRKKKIQSDPEKKNRTHFDGGWYNLT